MSDIGFRSNKRASFGLILTLVGLFVVASAPIRHLGYYVIAGSFVLGTGATLLIQGLATELNRRNNDETQR